MKLTLLIVLLISLLAQEATAQYQQQWAQPGVWNNGFFYGPRQQPHHNKKRGWDRGGGWLQDAMNRG